MSVFVQNVNSTELRISFSGSFSLEQVNKIKTIKGRRWYSTDKYWAVPYTEATVKYLLCVFADEEVLFNSANMAKDSNVILGSDQPSNRKEGYLNLLDSLENGLDDLQKITCVENYGAGDKCLEMIGKGNHNLTKGMEEAKESLPAMSDRTTELLLLVRKELELRGLCLILCPCIKSLLILVAIMILPP